MTTETMEPEQDQSPIQTYSSKRLLATVLVLAIDAFAAFVITMLYQESYWNERNAKRLDQENKTIIAMTQADTAAVQCNKEGDILAWNMAATKLTGWTQDELFGKSLEMVMPREKRDGHRQKMAGVMQHFPASNVHVQCELLKKLKDKTGEQPRVPVVVEIIELGNTYVALMRPK